MVLKPLSFVTVNFWRLATILAHRRHITSRPRYFAEAGKKSGGGCVCLLVDRTGATRQVLRMTFRCCLDAAQEVRDPGRSRVAALGKDLSFLLQP